MSASIWFDDLPVIGKLPPEEAAAKLREVGDNNTAAALESPLIETVRGPSTFGSRWRWPFQDKPWQHTAHAFGYLAPAPPGNALLSIQDVSNIAADSSLIADCKWMRPV